MTLESVKFFKRWLMPEGYIILPDDIEEPRPPRTLRGKDLAYYHRVSASSPIVALGDPSIIDEAMGIVSTLNSSWFNFFTVYTLATMPYVIFLLVANPKRFITALIAGFVEGILGLYFAGLGAFLPTAIGGFAEEALLEFLKAVGFVPGVMWWGLRWSATFYGLNELVKQKVMAHPVFVRSTLERGGKAGLRRHAPPVDMTEVYKKWRGLTPLQHSRTLKEIYNELKKLGTILKLVLKTPYLLGEVPSAPAWSYGYFQQIHFKDEFRASDMWAKNIVKTWSGLSTLYTPHVMPPSRLYIYYYCRMWHSPPEIFLREHYYDVLLYDALRSTKMPLKKAVKKLSPSYVKLTEVKFDVFNTDEKRRGKRNITTHIVPDCITPRLVKVKHDTLFGDYWSINTYIKYASSYMLSLMAPALGVKPIPNIPSVFYMATRDYSYSNAVGCIKCANKWVPPGDFVTKGERSEFDFGYGLGTFELPAHQPPMPGFFYLPVFINKRVFNMLKNTKAASILAPHNRVKKPVAHTSWWFHSPPNNILPLAAPVQTSAGYGLFLKRPQITITKDGSKSTSNKHIKDSTTHVSYRSVKVPVIRAPHTSQITRTFYMFTIISPSSSYIVFRGIKQYEDPAVVVHKVGQCGDVVGIKPWFTGHKMVFFPESYYSAYFSNHDAPKGPVEYLHTDNTRGFNYLPRNTFFVVLPIHVGCERHYVAAASWASVAAMVLIWFSRLHALIATAMALPVLAMVFQISKSKIPSLLPTSPFGNITDILLFTPFGDKLPEDLREYYEGQSLLMPLLAKHEYTWPDPTAMATIGIGFTFKQPPYYPLSYQGVDGMSFAEWLALCLYELYHALIDCGWEVIQHIFSTMTLPVIMFAAPWEPVTPYGMYIACPLPNQPPGVVATQVYNQIARFLFETPEVDAVLSQFNPKYEDIVKTMVSSFLRKYKDVIRAMELTLHRMMSELSHNLELVGFITYENVVLPPMEEGDGGGPTGFLYANNPAEWMVTFAGAFNLAVQFAKIMYYVTHPNSITHDIYSTLHEWLKRTDQLIKIRPHTMYDMITTSSEAPLEYYYEHAGRAFAMALQIQHQMIKNIP